MDDNSPEILLIGATGLVGRSVIARAGARALTLLTRRQIDGISRQHTLRVATTARWADTIHAEEPDVLICCLGTTIRQAGSQAAFRAVDHDLILSAARGALAGGTQQVVVVSSVGASAKSSNFYLRIKGETEQGLRALGFARLDIMRPGLLVGDREGPARFGESLAKFAVPFTDALLHGNLRRYRSTRAATLAKAIIALSARGGTGVHVHENDSIAALAD